MHTMPRPMDDFDCRNYVKIAPDICCGVPPDTLSSVLAKTFDRLAKEAKEGVNLSFLIQSIKAAGNNEFTVDALVTSQTSRGYTEREYCYTIPV